MSKARSVSFVTAWETMKQAECWRDHMIDPGVILQLNFRNYPEKVQYKLFAVCTQSEVDEIQKKLNKAKKEKANV